MLDIARRKLEVQQIKARQGIPFVDMNTDCHLHLALFHGELLI